MTLKPLYIPKAKKYTGLQVFCRECKTTVYDVCRKTGKSIHYCRYGDRHLFKIFVYIPGTTIRKTKDLKTRSLEAAVQETIEFRRQIRESHSTVGMEDKIAEELYRQSPNRLPTLIEAMMQYIRCISNDPELVPPFRRKIRTKSYILDVEHYFIQFLVSLKINGYDINPLQINEVNDVHIAKFYEYLLDTLKLSPSTYNKHLSTFTSLYEYFIHTVGHQIRNPFKDIPHKHAYINIETITKGEYQKILEIVQKPELGKTILGSGEPKDYYKPWLKDAIELGLETGRRNEELALMKWNDIFKNEKGELVYIRVPDYKVNRLQDKEGTNTKFIYVPVTQTLKELLIRIGYNKYKESDKYIIAPEELLTRNTVKFIMGRSFSHYYKQLKTGKNISFKSLRKTYISQLAAAIGVDNARIITKHSGVPVMEQHYLDKKVIAMTAKKFKMFSK